MDPSKERGWKGLTNGDLLDEAERNNYEVFLTADQSIRYQQNLTERRIALLVLMDNSWPNGRTHWIPETVRDIGYHKPGELASVILEFLDG